MMMDERPATDTNDDDPTESGVKSREGADTPGSTQRSGSGDDRSPNAGAGDTR